MLDRYIAIDSKTPALAPNVAYLRQPPRNYRIGAILSAILCFFPIGILSIISSRKVTRALEIGDHGGAMAASDRTRLLIQITVIVGGLIWFGGLLGIIYVSTKDS
ncbi:synapse differentiation-inducing gene protein 1-like isoform X2 [Mizuhopecten yessoensis]|uniref:synapse differentiation-inducing gene protein 1-like isoform X2 n=1 Tax=Mizuhopecten yessoensis TaxID=6573 RepID=UPI000B458A93|nr:synapse differentiation-inducing gene protein 1-like isoform X2 [Mizuhopecten yessoensis]